MWFNTAICPKYLNIRRSGYICSIVGLYICPWQSLSNSSSFISYLSAYSTFVSSIAGVMFSDYYFVRREHLDTNELYSASSEGLYYYILHKLSPVKIYLNNEEKLPSSEVNTNTHVEYFWSNRDYIDVNG